MPNTGKPSPNCHLCRQRRVKCDLARPQCQRCIKYGVQCPGYRDDQSLRFQHADSAKFEQRRRKKHQHVTTPSSDTLQVVVFTPDSTVSSPASSVASHRSTPPLLRAVWQHWTAESVPLVLGCYSSLDFLPSLFKGLGEDHCLTLTGHVFTRAYVINRFGPHGLGQGVDHRELSTYLGKALSSVSSAVNNPNTCTSDATIVAVWLLGNYELMMGGVERRSFVHRRDEVSSPAAPWHIHSKGLLSLLRARGDRQLYSRSGRQIFWVMHNIIQIQCTITNTPCPPEFDHWLCIIERTLQPQEPLFLHSGRYISSACSLLSRLMPITGEGDITRACAEYEQLLAEFDKAELDMLGWMHSAPQFQIGAGPVFRYFWNTWRGTRIKLHHMMILVTNLVEHAPDCPFDSRSLQARRRLCLEIIATTAQEVVDSIPESSGDRMLDTSAHTPAAYFDAIRLIWPLSHLYVVPTAPRHLRIVAREALLRIGREKGILTALKPRPGGWRFAPEALKGIALDDLEAPSASPPYIVS
ncbi:hypothetical protein CCHL11_00172 [Colletotrichum chlorophyti]|uniref:Zn(2)-C6 fungal-type domain-containing protein n=1 Tax=Colletotrichum chlorophyti TaxID=708187 RepID=A0A1Q8RUV6_9PEZI|nr:hypothetical protein CCHL11_00172 [Colletotrichum chlorophyti]